VAQRGGGERPQKKSAANRKPAGEGRGKGVWVFGTILSAVRRSEKNKGKKEKKREGGVLKSRSLEKRTSPTPVREGERWGKPKEKKKRLKQKRERERCGGKAGVIFELHNTGKKNLKRGKKKIGDERGGKGGSIDEACGGRKK